MLCSGHYKALQGWLGMKSHRTEATSIKLGNSVGPSSEDTSNDTAGLRECTDYNEYMSIPTRRRSHDYQEVCQPSNAEADEPFNLQSMNSLLLAARFLDMEIPNFPSDYPPLLEQINLYETECFCCINKALLVKYVRLRRLTLSGIYSWNKIFVVQSRPPALPVGFRFPRVLRLSITPTFATPIPECTEVITNTRHGEPSLVRPVTVVARHLACRILGSSCPRPQFDGPAGR
jgi:hypothetical protein